MVTGGSSSSLYIFERVLYVDIKGQYLKPQVSSLMIVAQGYFEKYTFLPNKFFIEKMSKLKQCINEDLLFVKGLSLTYANINKSQPFLITLKDFFQIFYTKCKIYTRLEFQSIFILIIIVTHSGLVYI